MQDYQNSPQRAMLGIQSAPMTKFDQKSHQTGYGGLLKQSWCGHLATLVSQVPVPRLVLVHCGQNNQYATLELDEGKAVDNRKRSKNWDRCAVMQNPTERILQPPNLRSNSVR